jgi:hypothetical protein
LRRLPGYAITALGAVLLVCSSPTIVRSDGSSASPTCALQFPPDESDEGQTVNLIGDFGDSVRGPTPVAIRVVGALQDRAPEATRWRRVPPLPEADVEPLSGGPYIVDAWTLTPAIYRGDANRCTVGKPSYV